MPDPDDTDRHLAFASTVPPSAPDTIPAFDPPNFLSTYGEPVEVRHPREDLARTWGEVPVVPESIHEPFCIVRPVTFLPTPVHVQTEGDLFDLSTEELDE